MCLITMFYVEALLDIDFHNLSLMNSTYPSTICDESSASYARTLAKNSVSGSVWVRRASDCVRPNTSTCPARQAVWSTKDREEEEGEKIREEEAKWETDFKHSGVNMISEL
jgi:hypothetical protein